MLLSTVNKSSTKVIHLCTPLLMSLYLPSMLCHITLLVKPDEVNTDVYMFLCARCFVCQPKPMVLGVSHDHYRSNLKNKDI